MKNIKKAVGEGFKAEMPLFGAYLNSYAVYKFNKKDSEEIAVALVDMRKDYFTRSRHWSFRVCMNEPVYYFKNNEQFNAWIDSIHDRDGIHLYPNDAGLIVRAYPALFRVVITTNKH